MPADNVTQIERAVRATIDLESPTEEDVLNAVAKFRIIFPIEEHEFELLIKRLHAKLLINLDTGSFVVEDHQSWLPALRPEIDPFYWDRYAEYLNREDWAPNVINGLDKIADEILDLTGNPNSDKPWKRKGLVMGDVQSGKTATYTALCCKAADAGYRLIILLTGTIEKLRKQTQERLDAGFVGLDSSGLLSKHKETREVGVGLLNGTRMGVVMTSTKDDFRSTNLDKSFRLDAFNEPVLVVVKKNKAILENLETWLRSYNAVNGKIHLPMLLIDDEADNASVNTKSGEDDPTTINRCIRDLLDLFVQSTYIGFTATPFANIFIDPESINKMTGEDLFPRHFIYALEAPDNYIGAKAVFGDGNGVQILREIRDAEDVIPVRHKIDRPVIDLPESLHEALRSFVITNALRDLRGHLNTHRSMLVNVSRFTDIQDRVAYLIDEELRNYKSEIRNYSQLEPLVACKYSAISSIRATYEREYSGCGIPWSVLQKSLLKAALPIEVKSVNQRSKDSLDYSQHRDNGLRVVAIGGNSLSRGLTLEGLSTSYFYRNSQMYDTLLQMGRWFGYRDGYADLCRIWLSDEAIHWYRHIALSAEELRNEIRDMQSKDMRPIDFGLKVRAHPDSMYASVRKLIATARNKLGTSTVVEKIISVSGQGLETPRLHYADRFIEVNARASEEFIRSIGAPSKSPLGNNFWPNVEKSHIIKFLRSFESHWLNLSFQKNDLANFLDNTKEESLQKWDVVIPNGKGKEFVIAGIPLSRQERKVEVKDDSKSLLVSGSSARVGSRGIEKEGVDPEKILEVEERWKQQGKTVPDKDYRKVRSKPLLLLHVLDPHVDNKSYDTGGKPLVAVGLSFPEFDDKDDAKKVRYHVNIIEWKKMFDSEVDEEDMEDNLEAI